MVIIFLVFTLWGKVMKSVGVAYLLLIFLAFVGAHRFYVGKPLSAILFILTLGGFGFWWFIDIFLIPGMVRESNIVNGLYARAQPTTINVIQNDKEVR